MQVTKGLPYLFLVGSFRYVSGCHPDARTLQDRLSLVPHALSVAGSFFYWRYDFILVIRYWDCGTLFFLYRISSLLDVSFLQSSTLLPPDASRFGLRHSLLDVVARKCCSSLSGVANAAVVVSSREVDSTMSDQGSSVAECHTVQFVTRFVDGL